MDRQSVLKMFVDKDEKIAVAKILDDVVKVEKKFVEVGTDFGNPVMMGKLYDILSNNCHDITIEMRSGVENGERNIMVISPKAEYAEIETKEYLKLLQIDYNKKFAKQLEHRSILGSILGLGIEREKVGDIVIQDDIVVVLKSEIVEYVQANLERVGRVAVTTKIVENIQKEEDGESEIKVKTVASLRVDSIVSSVLNISRSKVKGLIESDKVFVNFGVCNNISKNIADGDIITVRGYGRINFVGVRNKSKKDKLVIMYRL